MPRADHVIVDDPNPGHLSIPAEPGGTPESTMYRGTEMQDMKLTRRSLLGHSAAGTTAAILAASSTGPRISALAQDAAEPSGILTIGREGNTTYTRNFNPFSPNAVYGTHTAIYERLLIRNPVTSETIPWLATKFTVAPDGKSVTFTTRENVLWSDGTPFTAADVAFTFDLVKQTSGGASYDYVETITAESTNSVVFAFNRPYSPGLYEIASQLIVPKHIWEAIETPTEYTNENPVGTGPFTEIAVFQPQVYEIHRNPSYWQKGKPYFQGIRYPAFPANEQVSLALINGDLDWSDIFLPNIEQVFVSKDPEHFSYWFATTGGMIQCYMNTTIAPFDKPNVRKAFSMAIDRDQVCQIAMSGYTHPADSTGLSDSFREWVSEEALAAGDWTTRNVDAANALLDEGGFAMGADGVRTLPDGSKMQYEIVVNAPSSDWVSSSQIIARGLADIGVDVSVKGLETGTWVERMQKGEFQMAHAWAGHGPTPFQFYDWTMSTETVRPIGEISNENFARYGNDEATALLEQFSATFDVEKQKEIVNKLQLIYVKELPAAPLFPSPEWGEFNTMRFTGFPSAENPYALGQSRAETAVLVLTTVKPVES